MIKLRIQKAEIAGQSATLTLRWAALDPGPACDVDQTWDLAIKRVVLRVNGGDSGSGGVTLATRSANELSAVTMVPDKQFFRSDQFIDEENCEVIRGPINNPQTAIAKWYSYDTNTHSIEPSNTVYVVEITEEAHVKIKLKSYDDGKYEIACKTM